VGFGTELLFLLILGLVVVLGPKRMHSTLGYLGRAKAEFDKARREIKSQVFAELPPAAQDGTNSPADGVNR
jgi:Sec-independent protein translocase protein TatA